MNLTAGTTPEEGLLESARRLLGGLSKLNDSLLVLENRLYYQGDGKEQETKAAASDLRTSLEECHYSVKALETRVDRILTKLGE